MTTTITSQASQANNDRVPVRWFHVPFRSGTGADGRLWNAKVQARTVAEAERLVRERHEDVVKVFDPKECDDTFAHLHPEILMTVVEVFDSEECRDGD